MRIATRLLLIGLFASGLSFYIGIASLAQQPGSVTVRPRVTATQPGVPEVTASVDRSRVPPGSEVTFTLAPARVVADSRYRITLFFGDGKRQVVRQSKVAHSYLQSGTYTYSVLVESEKQSTPTPTPLPAVPNVKLLASPTSVEINRPVSFSAQLSRRYQNLKYRFVFGDGSATGWQDEAKATHSYREANTFKAYVDIGVVSNESVKQAGGSARELISVAEPLRPATIGVKLSATPASIESGKSVTFTARAGVRSPNAKYRFDFGDQSATAWQENPSAAHRYRAAGQYSARVELRVASMSNAPQTASDSTTIEVTQPVEKATIDLKVIPATVPLGMPILFQAVPSTASAHAVYRFNFGDGSAPTEWSADPTKAHVYKAARNYAAFAEMAISGNRPVTSGRKQVRVTSIGQVDNTNRNQNSNSGNNTNSTPTPRSNTNRNTNSNGNANSNRKANSNANGNWSVTGETNSNANSNPAGNIISNANNRANENANSLANANSHIVANTNGNNTGNRNANANLSSPGATNSNADFSPAPTQNPEGAESGASTNWRMYAIIAAIILFAAYQAFSYFFAPRPTFVPHFDPGDSKVAAGKPLSIDLQIDVDPNIRDGEVRVETEGKSLIKAKRIEP
ncbi:MAG TPA: PKD domain-containing protein [Pyrinomonadaceae bacterium]|nr:PKD domain-containing protein [Pyrinomonadaceae bacterium]